MQRKTKIALKRMGITLLWMVVMSGFVVLLVAAVQDKDASRCKGITVKLVGDENKFFIEEKDIKALITNDRTSNPVGMAISNINIANLERIVSRDPWVKNAEIFIDNQRKLNIKVTQREPVARVFTTSGSSFYFDKDGDHIPVSSRYAAQVPVFTDFPTDAVKLQKADSAIAAQVIEMGSFIMADPFWLAQIDQVQITPQREFELTPKLGDHVIAFGDGTDIEKKFSKLLAFYKEGLSKVGWNNYSRIDVAYENEVVCTRRNGAEQLKTLTAADSAQIAGTHDSTVHVQTNIKGVKQPETTKSPAKMKVVTPKPKPAKPKVQKETAPHKKEPKAVYKPVKRSVNTTKNNRTP
jgi:cell division protein FtsQ